MDHIEALNQLCEAPPADDAERTKLCTIISIELQRRADRIRDLETGKTVSIAGAATTTKARSARRDLREALVWLRGSSLTVKMAGPDFTWLEQIWSAAREARRTLRLRPMTASGREMLDAFDKGLAVRALVGDEDSIADELQPDVDVIAFNCVARTMGGGDGRTPICVFRAATLEIAPKPHEPPLVALPYDPTDTFTSALRRDVTDASGKVVGHTTPVGELPPGATTHTIPVGTDVHMRDGSIVKTKVEGEFIRIPVKLGKSEVVSTQEVRANGKICSACRKPQFFSDNAITCENGHNNATGITPIPAATSSATSTACPHDQCVANAEEPGTVRCLACNALLTIGHVDR